jgi:hypothetical protein
MVAVKNRRVFFRILLVLADGFTNVLDHRRQVAGENRPPT